MSEETETYRDLLEHWLAQSGAKKEGSTYVFEEKAKVLLNFGKETSTIDRVTGITFGEGGYIDIVAERNRTFTMLHRVVAVQVGEESDGRTGFL